MDNNKWTNYIERKKRAWFQRGHHKELFKKIM